MMVYPEAKKRCWKMAFDPKQLEKMQSLRWSAIQTSRAQKQGVSQCLQVTSLPYSQQGKSLG